MAKLSITFLPFPKLSAGNDDLGSFILVDGKREGCVVREVDWRDVGILQTSYRAKITGYVVEIYDGETDDRRFDTLVEARAYAREFFAKKGA